jgi:hypothetical protein
LIYVGHKARNVDEDSFSGLGLPVPADNANEAQEVKRHLLGLDAGRVYLDHGKPFPTRIIRRMLKCQRSEKP